MRNQSDLDGRGSSSDIDAGVCESKIENGSAFDRSEQEARRFRSPVFSVDKVKECECPCEHLSHQFDPFKNGRGSDVERASYAHSRQMIGLRLA